METKVKDLTIVDIEEARNDYSEGNNNEDNSNIG
jgi:hypothetical protein